MGLIEKDNQAELNGPRYEPDKIGEMVEVPTSLTLKERADAAVADKAPKFYGIAAPEKRVCTTWEECKKICTWCQRCPVSKLSHEGGGRSIHRKSACSKSA